jgi:hypothetical protein
LTDEQPGIRAEAARAWAASGMAFLTGRPDGPALGAPRALVTGVGDWADQLLGLSTELGRPVRVDPLWLLAERAALTGLTRSGATSCGGGTRLLAAADGWLAVSLARADDWALTAAWLERDRPAAEGAWDEVADRVRGQRRQELQRRGELLGLPISVPGERRWSGGEIEASGPIHGIQTTQVGSGPPLTSLSSLTVLDLSSLWAGPLASRLLGAAGARVVKVESTTRPDGARGGAPAFFGLLNGGKESVALALATAAGRRQLAELVGRADVVITASRPRALDQLGLTLSELVAGGRPRLWLSITGYGTAGDSGHRVGFGDDAAAAGGLLAGDDLGPCFCGDAIADPLSGLASALAVLAALAEGGSWVIDASMADIAGGLTGPALSVAGLATPPPALPVGAGRPAVHPFGADTATVLGRLPAA